MNEQNVRFMVPIDDVELWEHNPRNIRNDDLERLIEQITELGQYKPLIAYHDPKRGKWIVLGGNMRLIALRQLDFRDVWIAPVYPKNESEKLKIALSDNDRAGEYDEQQLAELVFKYRRHIDLKRYKIDLGRPITIESLGKRYGDISTDKPEIELKKIREVVIECETEDEQRDLYERFTAEGLKCRILTL